MKKKMIEKGYVLRHKYNRVYLKYVKYLRWNRFVCDVGDATVYDKRYVAAKRLNQFKHPENWEIINIGRRKNEKV